MKFFYFIYSSIIVINLIICSSCSTTCRKKTTNQSPITINGQETNSNKNLLLFAFVANNDLENTKRLLEKNSNLINETTLLGSTALHYAVYGEDTKIFLYLLQQGANINHQDKKGNTALHKAVKKRRVKIIKILLDYNAEIDIKNKKNKTPFNLAKKSTTEIIKLFINKKYEKELVLLKQGKKEVLHKILQDKNLKKQKNILSFLKNNYPFLKKLQ